ncbi:MAG: NAD(P)/FAD-dependent oxidoreductase [Pseudomonadota bacterium]
MPAVDVAVVGGGLAGAVSAILLARRGLAVTLLEKEAGPADKVCGEFLSAPALASLEAVGVRPFELGALPITSVRIAARGRPAACALPFRAASLSRRRLDAALLSAASAAGVTVLPGTTVRRVTRDGAHWQVEGGPATLASRHVLLATGKSDLKARRRPAGLHDGMVGLKRYCTPTTQPDPTVDVVLFPGGYCGIQPVEGNRLNVCLAVSAKALKDAGGPDGVFELMERAAPHARDLLADASFAGATLAVGRVPYGFVRRTTDGPFYLGDQAAVIASVCGEGMGLALRSGVMAAEAIAAERPPSAFQSDFANLAGRRVRTTALMSRALCTAALQPAIVAAARYVPGAMRAVSAIVRTPGAAIHSPR